MENPKISIVVPLYNSQKHLNSFLDSLFSYNFNYETVELIFVVDGGNTNYEEIIANFKDNAIKLNSISLHTSQINYGQYIATIFGLLKAKGEKIITLDIDHYSLTNIWSSLFSEVSLEYDLVLFELIGDRNKKISRTFGSFFLNRLIKRRTNNKIKDGRVGSSLKIINSNYLNTIKPMLINNPYQMDLILINNTDKFKFKNIVNKDLDSSYTFVKLTELFINIFINKKPKFDISNTYQINLVKF